MSVENSRWRSHVVLVTLTASVFAAVPFLMRGLSTEIAELAAVILFPATIAAYIFIVKIISGSIYVAPRQLSGTR
jgi:hypothetical protein